LEVPVATDFQIELSDGTIVFLNADSRLKYPTSFGSTERKVYLEGEAYFEVSKDAVRPFRVETKDVVIEVLGTSFNVNAYPEQSSTSTTLATGKVQINKGEQQVLLQPGEQACSTDTGFIVHTVDVREFISWKDGLFIFNNMSLEQIMRQMERWYGLSVTFLNPEVKKYTFTGMINKHLVPEETFSVIQKTVNVQFTISGKQVIIKK
jgi:ferric-dicitrate binding protein FerR (iron transport regulator)